MTANHQALFLGVGIVLFLVAAYRDATRRPYVLTFVAGGLVFVWFPAFWNSFYVATS